MLHALLLVDPEGHRWFCRDQYYCAAPFSARNGCLGSSRSSVSHTAYAGLAPGAYKTRKGMTSSSSSASCWPAPCPWKSWGWCKGMQEAATERGVEGAAQQSGTAPTSFCKQDLPSQLSSAFCPNYTSFFFAPSFFLFSWVLSVPIIFFTSIFSRGVYLEVRYLIGSKMK